MIRILSHTRLVLAALLLLASVAAVQAQFNFTTNNNGLTITGYTGPNGVVAVIPDSTNGYPVTAIGDYVFDGISGVWLAGVIIGTNVTSIGAEAFYNCDGLASLKIPDSVTTIGNYAFMDCTNLATIGRWVFSGAKFASIILPNSLTYIPGRMFDECTRLASVTFGTNLTTIGDYAFNGCTGLTGLKIPDRVTEIGNDV